MESYIANTLEITKGNWHSLPYYSACENSLLVFSAPEEAARIPFLTDMEGFHFEVPECFNPWLMDYLAIHNPMDIAEKKNCEPERLGTGWIIVAYLSPTRWYKWISGKFLMMNGTLPPKSTTT